MVASGFPFSTTYVESTFVEPPPTFLPEWIVSAGTKKASPAFSVTRSFPLAETTSAACYTGGAVFVLRGIRHDAGALPRRSHAAPRCRVSTHSLEARRLRTRPGHGRKACARNSRGTAGRRDPLDRRILGEKRCRVPQPVPEAGRGAGERRSAQTGPLPGARLVGLLPADLRSRRSGKGRVLADERVRGLRVRRVDDG